jgi:putative endonuclease
MAGREAARGSALIQDETESAFQRRKSIGAWKRIRKIELIESTNPQWRDPCSDIL